jgi:L-lactate dehydrogenase
LGQYLEVDFRHIHGYVLGEHGDSEMLTWSLVSISGIPLDQYCEQCQKKVDPEVKDRIMHEVRDAAYEIIDGKGATYYGIGGALARIVETILSDHRSILTVCTPVEEICGIKDVTIALPNHLGAEGIIKTLIPPLSQSEQKLLAASARLIKDEIETYKQAVGE